MRSKESPALETVWVHRLRTSLRLQNWRNLSSLAASVSPASLIAVICSNGHALLIIKPHANMWPCATNSLLCSFPSSVKGSRLGAHLVGSEL